MSGDQAPGVQLMLLTDLLARWAPGSQNAEWDWDDEYDWCWDHHQTVMADLVADIASTGIREPVLLGSDGRVWDGHHRICAAIHLFLTEVPVTFAPASERQATPDIDEARRGA